MVDTVARSVARTVGRYALIGELGSGGMASVQLAALRGPLGVTRMVAIKCLHPHLAGHHDFVTMLVDEASLAMRIHHNNVVALHDVVVEGREVFLVMEYVEGAPLSALFRRARADKKRIAPEIASAVLGDVLRGLHAAHSACDAEGVPLGIVHRDVSPQNVLVGADGVTKILDFGVAKARGRLQTTRQGELKGKLAYMAPEQVRGGEVTRRADVYAASIVLWELLTMRRLFTGDDEAAVLQQILVGLVEPPSQHASHLGEDVDRVVARGLAANPADRFASALEMATALEAAVRPASRAQASAWVAELAAEDLERRAKQVADARRGIERGAPADLLRELVRGEETVVVSRPASRRRRRWVSVSAVAALVGGAAALGAHRWMTAPAAEAAMVASADPPAAPASPSPMPTQTPSAEASTASTNEPASTAAPGRRPTTAPRRATSSKADCSVPYVVDAEGHRTYKRACL